MASTYDAIVLGAGHNGLILQAYLGRVGLSTICLEKSDVIGGGLRTVEFPEASQFLHNTHSFYHRGIIAMPWYRDLELEQLGARYLQPEFNVAMLCRDGRSLQWWSDFAKTVASFAAFSQRDADTLAEWRRRFRPIVQNILIPESQSPPVPPQERESRLSESAEGRFLLETSRLSPLEFVQREFEHPAVQAGLLFFNGLREVDLRLPGFGHHIPALLASEAMAQICVGGSARLAESLVAAVKQTGGEIQTGAEPRRIVVENGRAVGVETADGDRLHARQLVASSLNPQQTFLELIDPRHLPSAWKSRARDFQYNLIAPLFGLYLNLSQPPVYPSPELNEALMVILGLEHVDQFSQIVDHHQRGTIPPTVMWGSSPTRFDPSQAPPGKHTAFMWEKLPFHLHGNAENWDTSHEEHADRMLAVWEQYSAGLNNAVIDRFMVTPLDTQRSLANMRFGDLLVGAFSNGQVGFHRPFFGAGHYRGHLAGLYLCGSSCHPGGNVTGLPGYNCASVIRTDLKM